MDPRLVGGRYRVERFIGEGGVATVHQATDTFTGSTVALKMARPGDPAAAQAIKNEFRFAVTHRHPAFVSPYNMVNESGSPVIVMPLIHGQEIQSLNAFDPRCPFKRKSAEMINQFIAGVLECAAFIHFCGYTYNDFKPSNFLLARSDNERTGNELHPFILDFNLVSKMGEKLARRGTPEYVAPEVLLGHAPQPTSDLYSIGVMLYELLVGRPPYTSKESSQLIRMVTENGQLDASALPVKFRGWVSSLLSRDQARRPRDCQSAASLFGVKSLFDSLIRSRARYYLSAGPPPFAERVKMSVLDYAKYRSERIFLTYGLGADGSIADYLSAELADSDYQIERLRFHYDDAQTARILDRLLEREPGDVGRNTLLLIDDISNVSQQNRHMLRALLRPSNGLPVVASIKRWEACSLPHFLFDPLTGHNPENATKTVVAACLKTSDAGSNFRVLSQATGGDPEMVLLHLESAVETGRVDLFALQKEQSFACDKALLPQVQEAAKRMYGNVSSGEHALLRLLACWGYSIPMILLAGLTDEQRQMVDGLVASGHLVRGKSWLTFPSEDSRGYLYLSMPETERQRFHRFWAETAELYLDGAEELLELSATHWGRSDDPARGYRASMLAARELLKKGELARAKSFASAALALSANGGGSRPSALMVCADIAKQEGDYPSARKSYLELLYQLRKDQNMALKTETYKNLGDLYRSMKNPVKALRYIRKASALFEELHDEQGVANCHNNIGLVLWVNEEYERALESFFTAFEINRRSGNFQEIAKIQSNIGIIKDIMGKTSEVAEYFEQALHNARKATDPRLEALIGNNLGYFYIRQNDLERARTYLLEALTTAERIGYLEDVANALGNLAICSLRLGDLFQSIDYSQKALQAVETLGNKHLAADPQMHLIEVAIFMGNYALADSVLETIESDQIYRENKTLKAQVDLLRSRLECALGNRENSRRLAMEILRYADSVGDSRLKLEARIASGEATIDDKPQQTREFLARVANEAEELGHRDLSDLAGVLMARACLSSLDLFNAAGWIEKALSRPSQSKRMLIEARVLVGKLKSLERKYDEGINELTEIETVAGSSGFLPKALEAAAELADIYLTCGKLSKSREAAKRGLAYADRILSSLPKRVSTVDYSRSAIIARLTDVNKRLSEMDYMRI